MSSSNTTPQAAGRELLDWPKETSFYLTLDLECDFGTALQDNRYGAVGSVGRLVSTLGQYDLPLTCFVQTELFDERPEAVEELRNCSTRVTFHPHSHTHKPRDQSSIANEVTESTRRYREFFGTDPTGYRFPNGNVRESDYQHLVERGYDFDASVFPSWRPNHFNNSGAPTTPAYMPEFDLFELPFTVYSDLIRIPTALSYCRLLGKAYVSILKRQPPSVVVFNIHMHDLVTPDSYADLPKTYQLVYGRNDHGFELLDRILASFQSADYSFRTLDDAHDRLRDTRWSDQPVHSR